MSRRNKQFNINKFKSCNKERHRCILHRLAMAYGNTAVSLAPNRLAMAYGNTAVSLAPKRLQTVSCPLITYSNIKQRPVGGLIRLVACTNLNKGGDLFRRVLQGSTNMTLMIRFTTRITFCFAIPQQDYGTIAR